MDNNIIHQPYSVTLEDRILKNGHEVKVFWMTGLSGSGKSTLANAFQERLFNEGKQVFVLDGDNIRGGLNADLDFTEVGRKENIRRISEVAKLFNEAGFIVITAFISPFKEDREQAKKIIGSERFCEVYINATLDLCESRDVKGLYKKARMGEIKNFTGIGSPFEVPMNPNYTLDTGKLSVEECIDLLNIELSK
jgi:adenylyl-sulfate kinase